MGFALEPAGPGLYALLVDVNQHLGRKLFLFLYDLLSVLMRFLQLSNKLVTVCKYFGTVLWASASKHHCHNNQFCTNLTAW